MSLWSGIAGGGSVFVFVLFMLNIMPPDLSLPLEIALLLCFLMEVPARWKLCFHWKFAVLWCVFLALIVLASAAMSASALFSR